mmetsp:Transcript_29275/g.86607  ORF Transcript_29275/g.86607 Transcript_29275/m.86607 type:complete len:251 (-) Transcript_29275:45-797(-)
MAQGVGSHLVCVVPKPLRDVVPGTAVFFVTAVLIAAASHALETLGAPARGSHICLHTLQRRRLRDASLATAWPLSRKTVTNKAHALAASADRHIRPHGILTYASGLQSHAQWGTGASRRAAPCDDSWAGLVGTLTSRALWLVRNALGSWEPLRGGVASRIVEPTDARGSQHRRVYNLSAGRPCARGAPCFVGVWRLKGVFASFPCRLRLVNRPSSLTMTLRQHIQSRCNTSSQHNPPSKTEHLAHAFRPL